MKLATLRDGSRDGRLVVVSRDLTQMTDASFLVRTLQAALDDWARLSPHLQALAESLERGAVPAERFHEHDAMSPLPRAYRRLACGEDADGTSAVAIHPVVSDGFLGPREPIRIAGDGITVSGAIAVITGDVPMGATPDAALAAIRLVLLASDVSRRAAPDERPSGVLLASAFSPVAVTTDELGAEWDGGRLHRELAVDINGKPASRTDAGGTRFDFPALIAAAAMARPLGAGTIVNSGPISPPHEAGLGDTVRIEMLDGKHHSIFGAIEQTVEPSPHG